MWNSSKSVILSSICTKLVIVMVFCFAAFTPSLVQSYLGYTGKDAGIATSLTATIYGCCVPAVVALLCLDRLLANIRKDQVFIPQNVKYLRIISWACFAVAAILAVSGFYYIMFLMVAVVAAFFGLILRVVKNVIAQAIILKDENELTI